MQNELAIDTPAWEKYRNWRIHHKMLRDTIYFPRRFTGRVWTES